MLMMEELTSPAEEGNIIAILTPPAVDADPILDKIVAGLGGDQIVRIPAIIGPAPHLSEEQRRDGRGLSHRDAPNAFPPWGPAPGDRR
jgi:hypothetical protein